jgi:diguanylate cyclase (GGDEF)-like protein
MGPDEARGGAGERRDRRAEDRDHRAEANDEASEARDERAEARDVRAEAREQADGGVDVSAAADRAGALRDRRGGAIDRTQAADDREAASADRDVSARDRAASSIDRLTGAYRRDAGTVELTREVSKAKRTVQPYVLAFVDVDGLKRMNDSLGHAAGDGLLREVADAIRSHLRSYDLVIRFGGDEFVCGLTDVTVAEVAERFVRVNAELQDTHDASITVGTAALESGDSVEELIARADDALYRERQRLRSGRH